MSENVLESLMEKDKVETGVDVNTATTEPAAPSANTEVSTNNTATTTTEDKSTTSETTKESWYSKYGFENEETAEEFINTSRNKKTEEPKPLFASKTIESYNNFVANGGPDDLNIFKTVSNFSVSDNPTEDEMLKAIVTKRIIDDPDWTGREKVLENKIKKEYGLHKDVEYLDDDEKEEREIGVMGLKKEFKKTVEGFKELQTKTNVKVDEALETRLKTAPDNLKKYLDKELEKGFELSIPKISKGDNGKEEVLQESLINHIFDEKTTQRYREYYESFSISQQYPDLSDGSKQEWIKTVAAGMALAENLPSFVNKVWTDAVAFANSESTRKEIADHNPSVKGTHEKKATTNTSGDNSLDIFSRAKK